METWLDPSLSPSGSALVLIARARKRPATGEKVSALVAEAERERDYLQQLATDVSLCPDRPALDQVEEALVEVAGAEPSEDAIQHAAGLAARYSAARSAERVPVDYTERRFVRRIPGGRPGMVTYTHERTVVASPGKATDPGRSG